MQRLNRFGSSFGKTVAEYMFTSLMGGVTGYSAYLLLGPTVHQTVFHLFL